MLIFQLEVPIGSNHLQLGPTEYVEIVGRVATLSDGSEVAVHQGGMWLGGTQLYIAIQFRGSVQLRFGHPDFAKFEEFGPFDSLRIVDGSAWAGREQPQLLAHFDDTIAAWHLYLRPSIAMPRMRVTPV